MSEPRDELAKHVPDHNQLRDKKTKTTSYVNHPAIAAILALNEYGLLRTEMED